MTPVQQQLLGGAEDLGGITHGATTPEDTPLYGWLKERGLLDPANPPLKP
jgi:ectoine hydroxylase